MSRVCQITGRRTRKGNRSARRGLATPTGGIGLKTTGVSRRSFKPNIQVKRIWVEELGVWVRVKLSTRALKTITSKGAYRVLLDAGLIKPAKRRKRRQAPSED